IKAGEIQERETEGTISKLLPFLSESATVAQAQAAPVAVAPVAQQTTAEPAQAAESASQDTPAPPVAESAAPSAPMPEVAAAPPQKSGGDVVPKKAAPPPKPAEGKGEDLSDNTTVRVDVKRLDDLMNQVGELVLERNRMIQINQNLQQGDVNKDDFNEEFSKLTKRMNFVTSELQMQVLKMRMLPVEKVFKKFPRIVRSMARDLGKEVDLQIFGEETELDRS